MPKKIEDIIPIRKSIRDIPVPTRKVAPEPLEPQNIGKEPEPSYNPNWNEGVRNKFTKKTWTIGGVVVCS